MLVVTRRKDEPILIGENTEVTPLIINGKFIVFGITTAEGTPVSRKALNLKVPQWVRINGQGASVVLRISCEIGSWVSIGDDISLVALKIKGNQIRIGIKAPKDILILRKEISKERENNRAQTMAYSEVA